jgi:ketosteroid isomerase-like protein
LQWEPERADIAASGDLGWTTGRFVSEGPGPDGTTVRVEGIYVSIWRLQPDGTWKVVMDLGNPVSESP